MLTRPLTEKEKQRGRWSPSPSDRIIFEGTMEEAEEFFHQTEYIGHPVNAPIAIYTDGLPVRIPTEERVAEMLKSSRTSIATTRSGRRSFWLKLVIPTALRLILSLRLHWTWISCK